MTNWNSPQTSDTHSNELAATKGRDESNATMDYSADSNIPDGTIRWNSSQNRFELWDASGGTWSVLSTEYSITVSNAVDSDLLDGFDSGNSSGQIPISNGTVNSDFNADRLDGEEGSFYQDASNLNSGSIPDARVTESNVTQHGPAAVQTRFVNVDGNVTSTDEELNVLDGISGRTGSDVNLVSGTAGTGGNLAQWNADGDAVDSGVPISAVGALVPLAQATASSDATVEFTGIDSTYDEHIIMVSGARPSSDGDDLICRLSDDNGSTWFSGGSDYRGTQVRELDSGSTNKTAVVGTSAMRVVDAMGSGSNESGSFEFRLHAFSFPILTHVSYDGAYRTSGNNVVYVNGAWQQASSVAINGIQFSFGSGNVASGEFRLYGVKKS